nr:bifunctional diaminohydroxyphosphoribosylaminopyrimidine deaminase/5-amino-6-(5-phosphoribosylamino)uracil reductase RibD [uncultured Peptostreptococcus sp.]
MDELYMRMALELAERACGYTNPNPMVGAVIVKDGQVLGKGYHTRSGCLHAEREALKDCQSRGVDVKGATMYVTLEPCCHYGKTPPCTQAIIESGIGKVVVGSLDPNPRVAGQGIKLLRDNGIEVVTGLLEDECDDLNEVFMHYIRDKKPFVVMKYAMTADGKIATRTGKSQWITGPEARIQVHKDRHRYSAIMVGIGTVLADDPTLNCRIEGCLSPTRIICDTNLRIPMESNIVRTADTYPTIIATRSNDQEKVGRLEEAGCQVLVQEGQGPGIDLVDLMDRIGAMGLDSVLLEGGGQLNWSALEAGIVSKVQVYIGNKIFGGKEAKSPVGGHGVDLPDQARSLRLKSVEAFGPDLLINYIVENEVVECLQE